MLDAEGVKAISELGQIGIQKIQEVEFHINEQAATAVKFPSPGIDRVFSLTQIVSWIKVFGPRAGNPLLVSVAGPDRVEVWDSQQDKNLNHPALAVADFEKVYEKFKFGEPMSQENFIIELQTKFEESEARAELMKTVGSVRAEKVQTGEDDGVSQVAAMRAGVVLVEKKQLTNLWVLGTYRTFPEIEQPKIPYILRLHQRDDELPKFALYTCDGGLWKVNVAIAIRSWLNSQLKDLGAKVVVL